MRSPRLKSALGEYPLVLLRNSRHEDHDAAAWGRRVARGRPRRPAFRISRRSLCRYRRAVPAATKRQGGGLVRPAPRCVHARPGRTSMFLARQPPPPGGLRGAPSVHQGGAPRAASAPATSPAPWVPRRGSVWLVLGRSPAHALRRRTAAIAPSSAPPGSLLLSGRPDDLRELLPLDESGRPRYGVLGQRRSKV